MTTPQLHKQKSSTLAWIILICLAALIVIADALKYDPDELLYLLVLPILFAAYFFQTRIYLIVLAICTLIAVMIIYEYGNWSHDLKIMAEVIFTILIICELIHQTLKKYRQTYEELQKARDNLETQVKQRTQELEQANEELHLEVVNRVNAEQALRENMSLYHSLVESLPQCIYRKNLTGCFTYVNDRFCQDVGFRSHQIIGKTDFDLFSLPLAQKYHKEDQQIIKSGMRVERIENCQRSHGRTATLHVVKTPIQDADGNTIGVQGIYWDVTEHRHTQEMIEQSERMYREAIEVANAVPYYQNYLNQTYEYVGSEIETLTGYKPEEFTPAIWESNVLEIILLGDLKGLPVEEAIQKARGREGVSWRADFLIKTRSGHEKWLANAAIQVRNQNGEVVGSLGILQDITDRKRVEAELQKERDFITAIMNTVGALVVVLDPEGRIVRFNQTCEKITGYTFEEVKGRYVWEFLIPSDEVSQVIEVFQNIKTGHDPKEFENRWIKKDGEKRLIRWSNTCILNKQDGTVEFLIGTGLDITERKHLEEQFRQSHKMEAIGRLAGGVAHDFNNLLMAIIGYGDFALQNLHPHHPVRKNLEEIKKAADRAASLTRQLLAFSRKQMLQARALNLNDLITDMDKMLQRLIGEDIQLITKTDPELGLIKADPNQIEQVIMNLAVNARDAMPNGGKITIETHNALLEAKDFKDHLDVKPGSYVLVTVSDTGCGMDDEVKAKIFEPFFTTKEKTKGTGLGLSTIYGIIKQSGGFIWVKSAINQGSTFEIYLPRIQNASTSETKPKATESSLYGKETIVLAEDETMVRSLVSHTLKEYGYQVIEAENGYEALKLCKQHQDTFHLLFTDVIMPEMGGRELADQVKELNPDVKVLYMSGYTDDAVVHHGVLDPGIEFIQKPFSPIKMLEKIRTILDSD